MARQYAVPGSLFPAFFNATGTRSIAVAGDAFLNDNSVSPITVTPGAGSIVFTGFAPAVAGTTSPGVGSLVFTGFAPTVVNNAAVAPGAGSLVFTGFAPQENLSASPPTGHLVYTGFRPTVSTAAGTPFFQGVF